MRVWIPRKWERLLRWMGEAHFALPSICLRRVSRSGSVMVWRMFLATHEVVLMEFDGSC